jgi:hypothetical protein
MIQRLLAFDGLGIRPGLVRLAPLYDAISASSSLGALRPLLLAVTDHGILLLIAFGRAIHFIPARWTERAGLRFYALAPAVAVAAIFALLGTALPRLLAGPQPNIYFAF